MIRTEFRRIRSNRTSDLSQPGRLPYSCISGQPKGLRESEEEFRTLVDNAPHAVFVRDTGTICVCKRGGSQAIWGNIAGTVAGPAGKWTGATPDFHAAVRERIRLLDERKISGLSQLRRDT